MEQIQYGTIRIGQIVKLLSDSIGMDALLYNEQNKDSTTKMIQRLIEEKEGRIDNLRKFEELIKKFCKDSLNKNLINKAHSYLITSLYYDMLALITKTNPYNNPTHKEVELQIMYCLALTYREIYDDIASREKKLPGEILQEALYLFDFWKPTRHSQNIKLIPSCFDFIFNEINNNKIDLIKYWEDSKDNFESKKKNEEENKKSTDYKKTINDWCTQKTKPKWKNLSPILSSELPDKVDFKQYKENYTIFKANLFSAYFFTNFFNSLEEQKLVSSEFKETVQNGIRWFCWYAFEKNGDFTVYKNYEVKNPMFALMRFLVHPSEKNRSLLSEYIVDAFDKEIGMTPAGMYECKSIYYIPPERIQFPVINYLELQNDLDINSIIVQTNIQLSTWKDFGYFNNKIIQEEDLKYALNLPVMGDCKNFYYNWFLGKYYVLCHDFEKGLEFYKNAFSYKYYGGKVLCMYLEEFVVLMKKCKHKKTELNHILDWANALRLYIYETDKDEKHRLSLRESFEEVFPEEAFIK